MFFYLGDFSHTTVLTQKEHIYFGSHDNFYCLIFAMYLRTTLLSISKFAFIRQGQRYLHTSLSQNRLKLPYAKLYQWLGGKAINFFPMLEIFFQNNAWRELVYTKLWNYAGICSTHFKIPETAWKLSKQLGALTWSWAI